MSRLWVMMVGIGTVAMVIGLAGLDRNNNAGTEADGPHSTELDSPAADPPPPLEIPGPGQEPVPQLWEEYLINTLQDPTLGNAAKFDALWAAYQANKASDSGASLAIDLIGQLPHLPKVTLLLAELSNPMTSATLKSHLLAVLDSALVDAEGRASTGPDRDRILKAIYQQANNPDSDIAAEAIQVYARHGSPASAVAVLTNAFQHQLIGPSDIIRELAFKVPGATNPNQQTALISTLLEVAHQNDSDEVGDALIGAIAVMNEAGDDAIAVDHATQEKLLDYFRQHEPQFDQDQTRFGMSTAVSYYNWLNGYASISNNGDRAAADHQMLQAVLDPGSDSRKLSALLMSGSRSRLIDIARNQGRLTQIENKLQSGLAGLRPGTSSYSAQLSVLNQLPQGRH